MSETSALLRVVEERLRQKMLWGEQDHTMEEWLAILGEEYGEACRAAVDIKFRQSTSQRHYEDELIHVAATALAAVESSLRKRLKSAGIED